MASSQEERLNELAGQFDQIKSALNDLVGNIVEAARDGHPDGKLDESVVVGTFDSLLAQLKGLQADLDELSESLQGKRHD